MIINPLNQKYLGASTPNPLAIELNMKRQIYFLFPRFYIFWNSACFHRNTLLFLFIRENMIE